MFARFAQKSLFAAAALAAAAVTVSPAFAGVSGTIRTTTVSYADLDLRTDAGVSALNDRIRRAATQVCGRAAPMSLVDFADMMECRSDAVANARRASVTLIAQANSDERLAARDGSIAIRGR